MVKTRFEGVEVMNYSPLIYARGQENIAITGEGTLDGQASDLNWWKWKGGAKPEPGTQRGDRDQLFKQADDGVPVEQRVYGAGHFLRPAFIEPDESKNILIEGVTIKNAPFWVIHPTLSSNVTIRGITVISHGPNNDGADPESSTDVLIEKATFDTGDDCIAIKSGRNADGRRVNRPSERIVIRNSTMRAGHGGVTVGSEVSGSVRDVFAEKLVMSSPDLERGIRLKTNAVRGGVIENVFARDIEIGEVGSAIDIDLLYEEGAEGFVPAHRAQRAGRAHEREESGVRILRARPPQREGEGPHRPGQRDRGCEQGLADPGARGSRPAPRHHRARGSEAPRLAGRRPGQAGTDAGWVRRPSPAPDEGDSGPPPWPRTSARRPVEPWPPGHRGSIRKSPPRCCT